MTFYIDSNETRKLAFLTLKSLTSKLIEEYFLHCILRLDNPYMVFLINIVTMRFIKKQLNTK
jgi:hypothetical protein